MKKTKLKRKKFRRKWVRRMKWIKVCLAVIKVLITVASMLILSGIGKKSKKGCKQEKRKYVTLS